MLCHVDMQHPSTSWARITRTKSTLHVTVGTVKKSEGHQVLCVVCQEGFPGRGGRLVGVRGRSSPLPIWRRQCPACAVPQRCAVTPTWDSIRHISWMSARTSFAMALVPACHADLIVASGPGTASVARQSPCGAGRSAERLLPARPHTREPGPEHAIGRPKPRVGDFSVYRPQLGGVER